MSVRRIIKSVIWNFLGTFMSRYSEYDGYWLFGFLVQGEPQQIDLLGEHSETGSPRDNAARLAQTKFANQLEKTGIATSELRSATLWIARLPGEVCSRVHIVIPYPPHELERNGHFLKCHVEVRLRDDSAFTVERTVFVAPHDPDLETRSDCE